MFATSSGRGGFFYDWKVSLPVQLALPWPPRICTRKASPPEKRWQSEWVSENTLANRILTEKNLGDESVAPGPINASKTISSTIASHISSKGFCTKEREVQGGRGLYIERGSLLAS